MMRSTFSVDVARACQAALVVRDAMIQVALLSGPSAGRIPAGLVPGVDQFGNSRWRTVSGRGQLVGTPPGSLVVLPTLLGGRRLSPCRLHRPVRDLGQRRARRELRWRAVAVMLCELINPDDQGDPADQPDAGSAWAVPGAGTGKVSDSDRLSAGCGDYDPPSQFTAGREVANGRFPRRPNARRSRPGERRRPPGRRG
jgi:hypothetical protein